MGTLSDFHGFFTLEVPDGWERDDQDGVILLAHPAGVGRAYVAVGRHVRGRQASFGRADFLRRFLRSVGVVVDLAAIECREGTRCRIYSCGYETSGAWWRHWSVTDDETAVLISYTCPTGNAGVELDELDEMVRSVKLRHSPTLH
jgi:hypothetical protein